MTVDSPCKEFWSGKRVFLTGHTGFKGSWATLWLKKMGASVQGYSLEPTTHPNLFSEAGLDRSINHHIGDIRHFEEMKHVMLNFQPDIVLHMAAQALVRYSYSHPLETLESNVMGTANLLEAIRSVPTIKAAVIVTTDKVYENAERLWGYKESDSLGGYDPYSSSKACAEIVTAAFRKSFFSGADTGVLIATARAGNVIGGGDWAKDRLIPDAIRSFQAGRPVQIRNPRSIRPWQHVLEPLSGYFILAERLYEGKKDMAKPWNFGPEERSARPVGEVIEMATFLWGDNASWIPDESPHPHETQILKLNIDLAKNELSWRPRWDAKQALEKTVWWYREYLKHPHTADVLCLQQIESFEREIS